MSLIKHLKFLYWMYLAKDYYKAYSVMKEITMEDFTKLDAAVDALVSAATAQKAAADAAAVKKAAEVQAGIDAVTSKVQAGLAAIEPAPTPA